MEGNTQGEGEGIEIWKRERECKKAKRERAKESQRVCKCTK